MHAIARATDDVRDVCREGAIFLPIHQHELTHAVWLLARAERTGKGRQNEQHASLHQLGWLGGKMELGVRGRKPARPSGPFLSTNDLASSARVCRYAYS